MKFSSNNLALTIKTAREQKDLTQAELCEKLDITVRHLSGIETGRKLPSLPLLYELVHTLEIPGNFIFYPNNQDIPCKIQIVGMLHQCDERDLEDVAEMIKAHLGKEPSLV